MLFELRIFSTRLFDTFLFMCSKIILFYSTFVQFFLLFVEKSHH
nr:MAG TPA: hypothetical protein [Caudoviricetes sp.]